MINQVINIVKEASKLMKEEITIEQKGNDSNFVTSADVNVQYYLEERLPKLIPGSEFLGEEEEKESITGSSGGENSVPGVVRTVRRSDWASAHTNW